LEDAAAAGATGFFVSGGTVPLDSRSYVERQADTALFAALSAGRFCYVLNSRQMGKSSLCVRTMARLQGAGAKTAFVDLTKIGGRNVTPDQWYAGLVVEVGRALGLRSEMLKNWQEEQALSPMQRFFSALRDVALQQIDSQIVIFVDEIDATRSLSFSANEFFAGIRECYNRRVHDSAYSRLTFCLLGVAVPGDLVADPTTTPFNIGERVILADFTPKEAKGLATGFGPGAQEILHRILYWTHGHPFLTQSLASTAVSSGEVTSPADVDRLVADRLFQAKSRDSNINLADVGNRILAGAPDPTQVAKYRADVLSLYEKILKGQPVFDDESNKLAAVLKLSGIVRVEDRQLKVRNRIYERVFDKTWIKENMPGAELRRQRRAFIKGVVRTGLVAAAVVALIGWLGWKATQERDRANYEVYVATMNLMDSLWQKNNIGRVRELLEATHDSPARGWEWDYWNRMAHLEVAEFPRKPSAPMGVGYQANGKIYLVDDGRIVEYSPDSGQIVDVMPALSAKLAETFRLLPDGKRLIEFGVNVAQVIDLTSRTRLTKLEDISAGPGTVTPDGRWIVAGRVSNPIADPGCARSAVLWNLETGASTDLPIPCIRGLTVSPDGTMVAVGEVDARRGGSNFHAVVREFGSWKILSSFDTEGPLSTWRFSPGGDRLATGSSDGWVQVWDLKTRRETARVRPTESVVNYVQFSSDGAWLATAAVNRLGHLYDVSGSPVKLLGTFRDAATLSISPDKSRVAAGYFSSYEAIRIYDPRTYVETPTATSGLGIADGATVSVRKPYARARSGDKVFELDPITGESRSMDGLPGKVLGLPNNAEAWAIVQRTDGTLEIVDLDSRRSISTLPRELPKDMKPPVVVVQSVDPRRTFLFPAGKSFDVWDVTAAHLVRHQATLDLPTAAKTSPDGRWLALALANGDLSLWDTASWAERPLIRVGAPVDSVTFSDDGTRLLAGTNNDNAEVWNTVTGQLIGKLVGHSQGVDDAAYSPDGRRIVTASADTTVRIWDAATLRELTTLSAGNRIVNSARFTEDGTSIVSIDDQGTARMWLTKTPQGTAKK
jgi:WD40 repeat protein